MEWIVWNICGKTYYTETYINPYITKIVIIIMSFLNPFRNQFYRPNISSKKSNYQIILSWYSMGHSVI